MKNKKLLTMVLAAAMVVGSITVPAPMATVKADTVTTSRTNILREDGVVVSQQHGSARSLIQQFGIQMDGMEAKQDFQVRENIIILFGQNLH